MPKLKAKTRNKLPDREFGLPEKRAYPVEDKAHARNAKARAAQQRKAGDLSAAEEREIDAKADRVLHKDGD